MSNQHPEFLLYDKDQCPFCWKVRLAVAELSLPIEVRDYMAVDNEQHWRLLNPNGTVPVLVHQQEVLTDSAIIMEYLVDLSGELMPDSPAERAAVRALHRYSDSVLGLGLREVIFEKRAKPQSEWDKQRIQKGQKQYLADLLYLEDALSKNNNSGFFSSCYSLADAAITARLGLAEAYGVPLPDHLPGLKSWFAAMQARPSYKQSQPRSFPLSLSEQNRNAVRTA